MLNPENTSPGTCKKLQPSSLSGKGQRNQIDGSLSLDSVVCTREPNFYLFVFTVWLKLFVECILSRLLISYLLSLVPGM